MEHPLVKKQSISKQQNEQIIKDLIVKHIPGYQGKIESITPLQGLSNQTYKVTANGMDSLVFRRFLGIMNRLIQNKIFFALHDKGVAPKCLYACSEYRLEGFVEAGRHPTNEEMKDLKAIERVMLKAAAFHEVQMEDIKDLVEARLIATLLSQKTLEKVKDMNNHYKTQAFQELRKNVFEILSDQVALRAQLVPKAKGTIKLCHNDLNLQNIFLTENSTILIDFQYVSYNYISYDIANFLNEKTINYSVKEFPLFKPLQKLTKDQIWLAVSLYPKKYQGMELDVIKCMALCNLYWAEWSLDSANIEVASEFGSCEHGMMRIDRFHYYAKMASEVEETQQKQKKQ